MDPVQLAKLEHRRDVWLAAMVCLIAVPIAGVAMFATARGYNSQSPIVMLVAAIAAVYPALWAALKYNDARERVVSAVDPQSGEGDVIPESMAGDRSLQKLSGNHQVMRLLHIVAGISDSFRPDTSSFAFDDEGNLEAYAFTSVVPGVVSTDSKKSAIQSQLRSPLGEGWQFSFDPVNDRFSADRHDSLPSLVAPPVRRVVSSANQAAEIYDESEVHPGIGEDGEISVRLKRFVHWFIPGGTGGGKSVLARALTGERLALGHRFFILDGKGTDYTPYSHTPNISAISTTAAEHVILIHKVAEILRHRQQVGKRAARAGDTSWRQSMTPVTFIIDEWADARNTLDSKYKKELKAIDRDIEALLKVGREFRIHLIFSSQGTEAKTVPTDWFNMMKVVISAGPPARMTIDKAFPEEARGEVSRIGGQISPNTPGRAMVALTDPDTGKVRPYLFQSYYSYSPGDPMEDAPAEVAPQWAEFKSQVYDRIPRLYPREWVKLEYPDPKDGKDPYANRRDEGWVDLEEFTVADLHRLKPIALEDPDDGFSPITDNLQYDPLEVKYLGEPPEGVNEGAVIDV